MYMRWTKRWAIVFSCIAAYAANADGRVIILGFDGVDPRLTTEMMDAGHLPNLAKLREDGTFAPLESSNPPQSPTAWSSFATCTTPGNHNIYDFVRRNPSNYLPMVGFGRVQHAALNPDGTLRTPAQFESNRLGQTFWSVADSAGKASKILSVPFTYPAETLAEGCMLCGLGVPDIRGTTSTFYYLSDSFTEAELSEDLSGGMRIPLTFDAEHKATAQLPGARDVSTRGFRHVEVPVEIEADRSAATVTLRLPSDELILAEGEWSPWTEWSFVVSPHFTVSAISRFHALEVGEQVRLYMTCLQMHPERPYIPFTSPPAYGAELKERYGFFKTIGWIYDTHALRQNVLTEDLFLEDAAQTMAWREQLTLDEIDRGNFDLLVSAWTATDRVSHLFWAYRDPKHPLYTDEMAAKYGKAVDDTYTHMDRIVGRVMERLEDDDLLMVISDHGFHSFRTGFNVNTWLIREGYLTVKGQTDAATAFTDESFLQGFDWSKSRAYSIGLGSIFLNLRGREAQGTVLPEDADTLIDEIRQKLLALRDPESGARVFRAVYTRDDFQGAAAGEAPDLQLGYDDGFQSTKSAAAGAAPAALFEPNLDKWSGEHAASDVAFTPGIFFVNRTLNGVEPRIIDIGATALKALGVEAPEAFEGTALF